MLVAADAGDERFVRQLLDQGANDFNAAMVHAALNNHLNIVKLMFLKKELMILTRLWFM